MATQSVGWGLKPRYPESVWVTLRARDSEPIGNLPKLQVIYMHVQRMSPNPPISGKTRKLT